MLQISFTLKSHYLIKFFIRVNGSDVSKEAIDLTCFPSTTNRTLLISSKEVSVLTMAANCNLTVKSPPLPAAKALFTSTVATLSLTVTELISIALSKIGYL